MKKFILLSILTLMGLRGISQEIASSHKAIVKSANERFDNKYYSEAKKNFSQLISYYPSNPEFNYKFGVCNVMLGGDPNISIVHLLYANSMNYGKDTDYYLGRAYHRNYDFNKAILSFQKYKMKASKSEIAEREVDRYIAMCRNGKGLLNSIKDVVVLDKKQGNATNFFRFYDLENLGGKILAIPEELKTKQDKKHKFNGVFYFNGNSDKIFYASYGKTGETGKDIYQAHLMSNGKFGRVNKLGGDINTPYDEDYAFLHADGRTMYFSSEGHNSMGGYDIFKAEYDEGTSTFRNVVNMDFAVNTPDDDIFYIADSLHNNAWFSSSRNVGENEMNIYNVKVKGIPINLIFIKGNFLADFDENLKNATITMKDELTGKVISKVNTNSRTGDYILSLTKPGLYKIEVNAENSPQMHEGYVQIPEFDQAVALGQELRLINESGQEKLIINNSFNSPLDEDISELSKEFLKRKAGLEITPEVEEDEVIADNAEVLHIDKTEKNALLSAGFSESTSMDQVLADMRKDIETYQDKIAEIKQNNKAAFAYALQKQEEADLKLKESQEAYKAAETLEGNEYRSQIKESNRLLLQAEDLSTDAKAAYRIAKRSELIADNKAKAIDDLNKKIEKIEAAEKANDFNAMTVTLREEKNRINDKKGGKELSPGEKAQEEAYELEDLQESLLAEVKNISDKKTSIQSQINIKKAQITKLSKKKEIEAANAELKTLEEHLAITSSNLEKTLNEVRRNGVEEVILKKEAEFFEKQYINPDEIYLADVSSVSNEEVNQKLMATNETIASRKVSLGSDQKAVEILKEDNPEIVSWNDAAMLADASATPARKASTETNKSPNTKSTENEENLENYQVMIAIEKEVANIDKEMATYLADPKHKEKDSAYLKMKTKRENLELQHNDIYVQQLQDIKIQDKDIDNVITNVDPQYNQSIQEKLAATNEVSGFYEVREYRKELKDQLEYMAENNKQEILTEDDPRNLKKLIKKDVEFQSAINTLDSQINDVSLFSIAYDTENKAIIDSNRPSAETLPKQIELTENYIETLTKVLNSVDEEMHSDIPRTRKASLQEVKNEIINEKALAQTKLDSYNSDLDLTISTENQYENYVDSQIEVDFNKVYQPMPKNEQSIVNNFRTEYPDIFKQENTETNTMNDKIIKAVNNKLYEQKKRIANTSDTEEKAILKMDMASLIDLKEKVENGQYIFVDYRPNAGKVDSSPNEDKENPELADNTSMDKPDETAQLTNDKSASESATEATSIAENNDLPEKSENNSNQDNNTEIADVIDSKEDTSNQSENKSNVTKNNTIASTEDSNTTNSTNNANITENLNSEEAVDQLAESTNKASLEDKIEEEKNNLSENNIVDEKSINNDSENKSLEGNVANENPEITTDTDQSNQEINSIEENTIAAIDNNNSDKTLDNPVIMRDKAMEEKMNSIASSLAPSRNTPPMEAYGSSLFEDAKASLDGTEEEFTNLEKIRKIQAEIVGLENAVFDGEVKNNERKLNKKFEKLYSDLAYEEIKLANRLENYSNEQITNQDQEIQHLTVINQAKVLNTDKVRKRIKELQSQIEDSRKAAENKRYQITKSNDELERNFLAREAFALESDVIKNQKKVIAIYNNLDTINELDDQTLDTMAMGDYIYSGESISDTPNSAIGIQVDSDLKKIQKDIPLNYSEDYIDYINHLEVIKLQISEYDTKQIELNNMTQQVRQNKDELADLENRYNYSSNRKERRDLLELMSRKKIVLEKTTLDRNNLAEKVTALSAKINADKQKAEYMLSTAKVRSNSIDNTAFEKSIQQTTINEVVIDPNNTTAEINDQETEDSINELNNSNSNLADNTEQEKTTSAVDNAINNVISNEEDLTGNVDHEKSNGAMEDVNNNKSNENNLGENSNISSTSDVDVVNAGEKNQTTSNNTETGIDFNYNNANNINEDNSNNTVEPSTKTNNENENMAANDAIGNNEKTDTNSKSNGVSENYAETTTPSILNDFSILRDNKRTGAIPMNVDIPDGVVYRIQIGAFSKPVDESTFTEFTPLSGESINGGLTRYYVGWFNRYDDARYILDGVKKEGYPDAFIVAYSNRHRVNVADALQQSKEEVNSKPQSTFDEKALLAYYYSYPNAVKAELITPTSGLFYTVQIGVFSKPLTAEELGTSKDLNIDILPSKQIRYSTGRFDDLEVAINKNIAMHDKGFSDSFVTAYYNGKRIPVARAKELFGGDTAQNNEEDQTNATDNGETAETNSSNDTEGGDKSTSNDATKNASFNGQEAPVVVKTKVTKVTESGEGVKLIEMEYDVLIGTFSEELPFDTRKAINQLKEKIEVKEDTQGSDTTYYTARVKTLQEARNIQRELSNSGIEETEVRAFRVE